MIFVSPIDSLYFPFKYLMEDKMKETFKFRTIYKNIPELYLIFYTSNHDPSFEAPLSSVLGSLSSSCSVGMRLASESE